MDYVKEDYLLGNKKIIVGDKMHDLVLENLGRIYIRYGNLYQEFNAIIKSLSSSSSKGKIIIESDGVKDASLYEDGVIVYDAKSGVLYLTYNGELLILAEYVNTNSSKYVRKTGDVMTGQLVINTPTAPMIVKSTDLVENFNAQYLNGHESKEFARKAANETISGDWTFNGQNTFNASNVFNGETEFNETATFQKSGGKAAIRVGTGAIITDGSLGSSQFMSGYTGYGWRLDASTNTLEIDNLIVRGVLLVYELVVNKISATNGSMWITDSFKIKTIHKLEYINCADTTFDLHTLSENTFYIPYIYNEGKLFNINTPWSTIKLETALTNLFRVELNEAEYPLAQRLKKKPFANLPKFGRFNYLFQILNKDRFLTKFTGETTSVWEHYTTYSQTKDWGWFVDSEGFVRVADWNGEKKKANAEYNVQDDITANIGNYVHIVSDGNTNELSLTTYGTLEDGTPGYRYERAFYVNVSTTPYQIVIDSESIEYQLKDLADVSKINKLASEGIIEKTNLYLKTTSRKSEEEHYYYTDGETEKVITFAPQDPTFDRQIFTIAVGEENIKVKDGQYIFKPSEIAKVNLYYKYFGEELFTSLGGNAYLSNIYILESDSGEYPVFKPGDILRCQKFNGNCVKQYHGIVLGLIGAYGFIIQLQDSTILNTKTTYSYNENGELVESETEIDDGLYSRSEGLLKKVKANLESDEDDTYDIYEDDLAANNKATEVVEESTASTPEKDDALVRIGSIFAGDRQNSLYLTSSENNSPYQDILTGVNRTDFNVVYFTPKYKTFTQIINVGTEDAPIYKNKKFYLLNIDFTQIMYKGDKCMDEIRDVCAKAELDLVGVEFDDINDVEDSVFTSLDATQIILLKLVYGWKTLSDLPINAFPVFVGHNDWYQTYITYRNKCVKKDLPSESMDSSTSTDEAFKIVDVWMTNFPNDNSFYKENGSRLLIDKLLSTDAAEVQGGKTTWKLFSSNVEDTVLSINDGYEQHNNLDYSAELNLTIGETVSV